MGGWSSCAHFAAGFCLCLQYTQIAYMRIQFHCHFRVGFSLCTLEPIFKHIINTNIPFIQSRFLVFPISLPSHSRLTFVNSKQRYHWCLWTCEMCIESGWERVRQCIMGNSASRNMRRVNGSSRRSSVSPPTSTTKQNQTREEREYGSELTGQR